MAEQTGIQWTDSTWNPTTGCTKISRGCRHCYIDRTPAFRIAGRKFVRGATDIQLHPERLDKPLHWRKPRRVFVNSLSDLFHEAIPFDFVDEVFARMLATPQHVFQVLTKRPERARDYFEHAVSTFDTKTRVWSIAASVLGASREHGGWPSEEWPLPNVWLGVSIEDASYTWRADVLREIPAAVRFISAEPLLGSLFPSSAETAARRATTGVAFPPGRSCGLRAPLDLAGIDWVIVGGESGPGARPFHLEHAREIIRAARALATPCRWCGGYGWISPPETYRDGEDNRVTCPDCRGEGDGGDGPAVFVKQLGAKPVYLDDLTIGVYREKPLRLRDRKGGDWDEWPADLRIREFPSDRKPEHRSEAVQATKGTDRSE